MTKKPNKNPSKPLKDVAPPPLPFERHIKNTSTEKKKLTTDIDAMKTDDAFQMINHIRKVTEEMNQNIEDLIRRSGWTPDSKNFLENPSNFSIPDWEKLQSKRKELNVMLGEPEKAGQSKDREPTLFLEKQGGDTDVVKQRRTKTAGARRKWLPMR